MLTVAEFDSLEVGDQIETAPLFPILCDDPVVLRTVAAEADRRDFAVTYCGITMARWSCVKTEELGLTWTV